MAESKQGTQDTKPKSDFGARDAWGKATVPASVKGKASENKATYKHAGR